MPAQLVVQDQEAVISPPQGYLEPLPVTLGPNWRPGDVRLVMVTGAATSSSGTQQIQMDPDPPAGYSTAYALSQDKETEGVYWRRLQTGDADTSVAWRKPPGWRYFNWALLSVRGVDPDVDPVAGSLIPGVAHRSEDDFLTVDPVTVPGPGTMIFMLGSIPDPEGTWPSWATSIGVPGGWSHVAATDKSGDKYYAFDTQPGLALFGKSYASAGTTGTVTVPVGVGFHAFSGMWLFLRPAPDGASAGAAITATASVAAGSSSTTNTPHSVGAPITATAGVGSGVNPLCAVGVARVRLSGRPVSGSVVWCDAYVPPGAAAVFETSINNGVSWDVCANGAPVPRLRPGDTVTRQVLLRATLTRTSASGLKPVLRKLTVRVGSWKWSDELLRTFYGPVDKTRTKIVAGSSGGSGSSSGGPGVTARGGGLSGGGATVELHATDPSRLLDAARWPQPYVGQAGLTYEDLGRAMVLDRMPQQARFNQQSTGHTLDDSSLVWGLSEGATPLPDVRGVFAAVGHEAFWDTSGVFVSRPIPDPRRGPVVWEFDHTARPCMIGVESELDVTKIVNGWFIKGESSSARNPVSGYAVNWDVRSRYNAFPPPVGIGMRFDRKTFPLARTATQCVDIAQGALNNSLGVANTVTIGITAHSGIETGDVTRIDSPETGVSGRFLVQGWTLPDNPVARMELTCFRQTA